MQWYQDDVVQVKDIPGEELFGGSRDLKGPPPGQAEYRYPTEHISLEKAEESCKPCPLHAASLKSSGIPAKNTSFEFRQ